MEILGKKRNGLFKVLVSMALTLSVVLFFPQFGNAQAQAPSPPAPGGGTLEKGKTSSGPRKQLATIIFAGLGGAVLGLSTLSFYGRPQDNLRNIAIGAAFGVIAGTVYVTYKAATNPSELYGRQREIENDLEMTSRRNASSVELPTKLPTKLLPDLPTTLQFAFEF